MRELPYEERVELCEKMLKNRRPWTEISKKTGFGPNQISAIKKEKYGIDGSPKHTKAYALFEEGKSNYEVAQALGLTEEQTRKFKEDYLKLIGLDKLEALFHLGDTKIQSFLDLQAGYHRTAFPSTSTSASFQRLAGKRNYNLSLIRWIVTSADSKSSLYYYQSEADKSKLKITNLDWIANRK